MSPILAAADWVIRMVTPIFEWFGFSSFFVLAVRLLADVPPATKPDVIYVFAETTDNQDSVLNRAIAISNQWGDVPIAVCGSDSQSGCPGFALWRGVLIHRGFPEQNVICVPFPEGTMLHTGTESEALVSAATMNNWKVVVAIAPPFHQVRAMMMLISQILKVGATVWVYSQPGVVQPWHGPVRHSQGELFSSRTAIITGELVRILASRPFLKSSKAILAYLLRRDLAGMP